MNNKDKIMKKIKALLIGLVLSFSAPVFASDFDWSQCWCNYGAGIEKGDMLLSVDAALPWDFFDIINANGWAVPHVIADFEIATPIWKLPFTFGGYAGVSFWGNKDFSHTAVLAGGGATYHVRMPPKNLDLYSGLKIGVKFDISNEYDNGIRFNPDWGYNIGASWFFSDSFGVNVEFGFPSSKAGVVFKF